MLKGLAITAAVILGLTIYVACQNQRASSQYPQQRASAPAAAGSPSIHNEQPQNNAQKTSRNLPGWYGFFTWPDGMTAWAILLTLLAVAWQANETRKAAEATLISANAAKESAATAKGIVVPTLVLHEFSFIVQGIEDAAAFYRKPGVKLELKNYGQSPAFLRKYSIGYSWDESSSREFISYPFEDDVIDAGGTYQFGEPELGVLNPPPQEVIEDLVSGRRHLVFSGWVTYGDVFGSQPKKLDLWRELVEYDLVARRLTIMDTSPSAMRRWVDPKED